ncbi:UDP-3-O-(3-hydroxymyristoyl)glucosamine N-acyltransferase [Paracidovorax anthurii]|uniref:UDP-3-O-acylglucosamine N-acyltransferase n=1 Tax=Paracidovorax anthurii TaxID=78229 RepID=A0A328ZGZ4_9BURK|nr:UDP-3-O-(3-hydroxymyristoyl)glucosamine N-acyltransferase [Paracidovorax anthurii]RAR85590.1 UDP-3-O-[3-hydroxymyristoyl] glucosamine N-acyltransferase [Paracidovorax anthurii]WCM91682.1 UDP-3-O-(3-hydroxymyristoyl)glucosamine N-acyltransferase [Acidovorax sp. NCPPB 2350]
MSLRLRQIVEALGGTIEGGDQDVEILRIAPLESAGPGDLSFLSNPRYQQQLAASRAACVIVAPALREAAVARGACIVADDPYAYFARVTQLWKRQHRRVAAPGVHPSAVVDPEAFVHPSATVGPLCVVERGAHVGAGSVLASRVTIGQDCRIGDRCLLHPGVVIGADGFGFAPEAGAWVKIEQLGAVRIGNDVEIGANTCIDRGALDDTVIEDGVKLDNLIQIGHNVRIGKHTAMAGCSGVAGSARIGAHCTVGGGAIVLGHLELADRVHVSAATVVTRSITRPGVYTGMFPIDENAKWEKNAATLKQLHSLRERIKALEEQIQKNGQTAQFQ